MSTRMLLALFAVVTLTLVGPGLVVGGPRALAHEGHGCADGSADDSLMGLTDPAAPYDLRFIDEMIMHHQGAIISAKMMIGDSERPELRDLARGIQESQRRQIEQMRTWREAWYPGAPAPSMDMGSMADAAGMMGMMGGGMMEGMMGGDGADRMFLRMMIPHHQLAIEMAEGALQRAEHEELKGLAREIIQEQAAEIAEMEGYLSDWYGDASTRDAAGEMRDMMRTMMGDHTAAAAATPCP